MTRWLNVAPLLGAHEEELAADIRWLGDNTVVDSAAFICTLVPEGDPVFDKAAVLAARFRKMKALLAGSKVKCGILLQATMGHGWVPDSRSPFQKFVDEKGEERYIFCPLGGDFLGYVRHQIAVLAAERPDFFMLDDDTRLITGRNGCFCPLHVAEMSRRTGRAFTRETLAAAVHGESDVGAAYDKLLEDSIIGLARVIRGELDRVDPAMPCSFCCCAADVRHAAHVAEALAAPGQELAVRLNNGRYLSEKQRDVPAWLRGTAGQLAVLGDGIVVLGEPDTCPQNRYSTSASMLHLHVSMSLLEGCRGAKFWITRTGGFEPGSGLAYRKELAENRGFYEALLKLAPRWRGARVPISRTPDASLPPRWPGVDWGSAMLGRFGIPYANTMEDRAFTVLSDDADMLGDDEIRAVLSRGAVLDGRAALVLSRRGFGALTGVTAEEWSGPVASFEALPDGARINAKINAVKLVCAPGAEVLSELRHRSAALSPESEGVGPGSVFFANKLGGRIVTFAEKLPDHLGLDVFSSYNETRKRQVVDALRRVADGDFAYYPGDAEVLFREGVSAAGEKVYAVLSLSLDTLDEVTLAVPEVPAAVSRLMPDGARKPVAVRDNRDGTITLEASATPAHVAVFVCR